MLRLKRLTNTQRIAFGFFTVILVGATLLCLPISSRSGTSTNFLDCMFTATSATCVTGLVVVDTYTHWSVFGQLVILTLIQIGGLGFMTVITMFSIFLKRKISLHERTLLMQSAGNVRLSGIVRLIRRVLIGTFVFEAIGTILLATRFCPKMGFFTGLYNALFHSVSAFCNAGFDIMGKYGQFSSLTTFADDAVVNFTIMFLIVVGGIGFIVWNDIIKHKFKLSRYELHSKIVLVSTAILIFGSAILFFIFEKNHAFASLSFPDQIMASLFQAITPRTAGFNTVDITALSESGNMLTVILMLIGGSPGSTAGGIKTTTFVVLIMATISAARHTNNITLFKRRLDSNVLKQAAAVATIYLFAVIASAMLICAIEPVSQKVAVFEVVSAAGTVGLSAGITASLSALSQIVLMVLMFGGRVGGLSLMLVLAERRSAVVVERPTEKILIG